MVLSDAALKDPDILTTDDVRFAFLGWEPESIDCEEEKTPITLISGFLGAGKTSLLTHLLEESPRGKFGLIINDVGDVNLDAEQVRRQFPNGGGRIDLLKELSLGCICCTMGAALADALVYMHEESFPAHVLVEASGVANPRNTLQAFYTFNFRGHSLLDVYRIANLVTVIDTPHFLREWTAASETPSARRHIFLNDPRKPYLELIMEQVETCDVMILNKNDLLNEAELNNARIILKWLNPRAHQIVSDHGSLPDVAELLHQHRYDLEQIQKAAIVDTHLSPPKPEPEEHGHESHHDHHGYGLQTMTFRARQPFKAADFFRIMRREIPEVIRAKGFYWVDQHPDQCGVLSIAGGVFRADKAGPWYVDLIARGRAKPEDMPDSVRAAWLNDEQGDRRQEIVLIGSNLDQKKITGLLNGVLAV